MNSGAYEVGRLAQRLLEGYYTFSAALSVARHLDASSLAPGAQPDWNMTTGVVSRKNGTQHTFNFVHYLSEARTDADTMASLDRVWLVGALLSLGDALEEHHYFDKAPELQLVRHLRNGIAHGNNFDIRNPADLLKFPAHNGFAAVRGLPPTYFEITPALNGTPVLFDFMGPADVLDLLMSVELYLERMGEGLPLRR